ncbi:MAG: hypothetical protein RIT45_4176 [Pseudomonadota bacterium]|jgi:regulator of sirC expression with transglutaminase-like and TPR domain
MLELQLWSRGDDAAAEALTQAVEGGHVFDALLAIEGADGEARAAAEGALARWADAVAQDVSGAPGCPDRASRALRRVLVEEGELRGDAETYDAPENSLVTRVIERRRGQPILVSSIWLEVGRRAGVAVEGVGLPGHFVARVGGEAGRLVDPFSGGDVLSVRQCARIVHTVSGGSLPWDDAYLAPVSARQMAERVLRNLIRARRCCRDVVPLYRAVRLYAGLRSDDAEAALVHARTAEEIGALRQACAIYSEIEQKFPGASEARVAARRAEALESAVRSMH